MWGPLIGAAILIPLADTLNAQLGSMLPGIQGVVYGCAIIAVMLAAPEGIFWTLRDRFFRRPAPPVRRAATFARRALRVAHRPGTLLDVRHLSRSFGGLRAVDDVSFTVEAGEILGIIGPNGAGKTTLFNVLNGILPPTSGEAFFAGTRITGRKIHDICHLGIGRTFQVVRSFPRLPVLDNVVVGAYGAGLDDREAVHAAEAALDRVGLLPLAHREAGRLTNKELRLMELARASRAIRAWCCWTKPSRVLGARSVTKCWMCCSNSAPGASRSPSSSTRCTRCCAWPTGSLAGSRPGSVRRRPARGGGGSARSLKRIWAPNGWPKSMLLEITDLAVSYGGLRALSGVTLCVDAGQFVAVVGPNGAGKTTLFKCIAGIVAPETGGIAFRGEDLLRRPASARAHLGIAHVPEARQVFKTLTVRENIEMGAYPAQGRAVFARTLERIHTLFPVLAERATQLAGTLSGGEQQMLAIARGLAAPRVCSCSMSRRWGWLRR